MVKSDYVKLSGYLFSMKRRYTNLRYQVDKMKALIAEYEGQIYGIEPHFIFIEDEDED